MSKLIDVDKYWSWRNDQVSDDGRTEILFQDQHLSWLEDCQKVLDAGCGVGHLVRKLQALGKDATGLTYNPLEVDIARTKYGTTIVEGDLHRLPWPDQMFDAVVCWDALEHTVAPLHVLGEFRRVLKPGGKLLVFMPGDNWVETNYHILCLTMPQMLHLVALLGYKYLELYDYGADGSYAPNTAVYRVTT